MDTNDVEVPRREEEDHSPRPLSPPPNHFRRRVLSNSGPGGTGSQLTSPYTTPVNTPPVSPVPESQTGRRSIALHEILSAEDLVAPKRLTLYKPEEERMKPLNVKPVRYGSGMELRRVLSR